MAVDTTAGLVVAAFIACLQYRVYAVDLVLSGNTGSFLSDNYPNNYLPQTDQTYTATFTTTGPQQVRLQFDYVIDPPVYGVCYFDYFTIQGIKYCDTWQGVRYIVVPDNVLTLRFRTDNYANYPGFNVTYTVLEGTGTCRPTLKIPGVETFVVMPILDMLGRSSVVFDVQACSDVYILLSTDTFHPHVNMSEHIQIELGAEGNTVTRISTCVDGTCNLNAETYHSPLSVTEIRQFWVTWETGGVAIGSGSATSTGTILSYAFPTSMEINFLHLAGNHGLSYVITFDAPFLDEYCTGSTNPPVPDACPEQTTVADTTVADTTIADTTVADTTVADTTVADTTVADTTVADTTVADTTIGDTTVAETTFGQETTETVTQPQTTTQTPPVQIVFSPEQRPCSCVREPPPDPSLTAEEVKEKQEKEKNEAVDKIVKELSVPRNNVSAVVRRSISAPDERNSSKYMGVVAGAVCGAPFALIFLSDILALVKAMWGRIRRLCVSAKT